MTWLLLISLGLFAFSPGIIVAPLVLNGLQGSLDSLQSGIVLGKRGSFTLLCKENIGYILYTLVISSYTLFILMQNTDYVYRIQQLLYLVDSYLSCR